MFCTAGQKKWTNFIYELARRFRAAKIERARYPRNRLHPRLPRQFFGDTDLWYAKQSICICMRRTLPRRQVHRLRINAAEFLGQLLAFRKVHFGRWISDALNKRRGIMRSFAATRWRHDAGAALSPSHASSAGCRLFSVFGRNLLREITDLRLRESADMDYGRNVVIGSCYVCICEDKRRVIIKNVITLFYFVC